MYVTYTIYYTQHCVHTPTRGGMDSRTHTLQPLRYRIHAWLSERARSPDILSKRRWLPIQDKIGCVDTHPVLSRCTLCFNISVLLKSYGWYVAFDLGIFRNLVIWYLKLLEKCSPTWGDSIFSLIIDFHGIFQRFKRTLWTFFLQTARLYNAHQHQSWNTSLGFWKPLDLLSQEFPMGPTVHLKWSPFPKDGWK